MLKIKKFIIPILSLALIIVSIFGIYTNHKLQIFKRNCENQIEANLGEFARYATKEEYSEQDYAILYSNIESSANSLFTLSSTNYIVEEMPNETLFYVIGILRYLTSSEKETIGILFNQDNETYKLLCNISEDMYDENSTDKLYDILKSYQLMDQ